MAGEGDNGMGSRCRVSTLGIFSFCNFTIHCDLSLIIIISCLYSV
jgi:hypothetical protein